MWHSRRGIPPQEKKNGRFRQTRTERIWTPIYICEDAGTWSVFRRALKSRNYWTLLVWTQFSGLRVGFAYGQQSQHRFWTRVRKRRRVCFSSVGLWINVLVPGRMSFSQRFDAQHCAGWIFSINGGGKYPAVSRVCAEMLIFMSTI